MLIFRNGLTWLWELASLKSVGLAELRQEFYVTVLRKNVFLLQETSVFVLKAFD